MCLYSDLPVLDTSCGDVPIIIPVCLYSDLPVLDTSCGGVPIIIPVCLYSDLPVLDTSCGGVPIIIPVCLYSDLPVLDISCGDAHNCAVVASGVLFSWGDNSAGQLGIAHSYTEITKPRQINMPTGHSITQVACGANFSAALSSE